MVWAYGRVRCVVETKTLDDTVSRPEDTRKGSDLEADREDLALAEQALGEYEAKGIEGTVPYDEYRKKRLGTTS